MIMLILLKSNTQCGADHRTPHRFYEYQVLLLFSVENHLVYDRKFRIKMNEEDEIGAENVMAQCKRKRWRIEKRW